MSSSIFFIIMFYTVCDLILVDGFKPIWNVPTFICEDKYGINFNLSRYGVLMNVDDVFRGDVVTIFYRNDLGLYPWIDRDGNFINGGLPQLGDLKAHLKQVSHDIQRWIPDPDYDGVAVIDWEEWRPIFVRNGFNERQKVYIEQSEALVRKRHPDWSYDKIKRQAETEFEEAARTFMQMTLEACQLLRPRGRCGFYGFPSCYNHRLGQKRCSDEIVLENNRLSWMFNSSTALFPSTYLEDSGTHEDRFWQVRGDLKESIRVQGLYAGPDTPILPYTRYRYRDTGEFYDIGDLNNTVEQAFNLGLDGVIFWDSSETLLTVDDCVTIKSYVINTLGPYVKQFTYPSTSPKISQTEQNQANNRERNQQNTMESFNWMMNLLIELKNYVLKFYITIF